MRYIVNFVKGFNLFSKSRAPYRKLLNGKVVLYKNTVYEMHSTGNIMVENGVFQFNKPWTKNDPFPSLLHISEKASLIVTNSFHIYSGARVYVNKNSTLILGSGYINNNLNLTCFEKIEIGHNVAISSNVTIRDSDSHTVSTSSQFMTQPIKIGHNVWIGVNVTILKGVEIGDGTVIAAGAVVNKSVPARCLAGGVPAKVIRENVHWY